jgi:diguanylate cyclase
VKRISVAIYLALIASMSVAYFVVDPTPTSKLFLYNGVGLLSIIAMAVGIKVYKPKHRAPWVLFMVGRVSFLLADLIYYWLEKTSETGFVPFPSIADGFFLLMYPLVITGLGLMLRRNASGTRDWAGLIDAGIFAIALFSTLWVLVMDSYVAIADQPTNARLISLAYPVADLAVLFVAIRLAVTLHRRHASLLLIIAALCSLVVADVQYGVLNAANGYQTGGVVDAFWLGFYVLFSLAAIHPSMAKEFRSGVGQRERITNGRLVLMFVATLTVPVIDLIWGGQQDRFITLTSSAVLFALMLARVLGLVRSVEHGRELLRREARHDPLTGLVNRTQFAETTASVLSTTRGKVAVLLIDLDDFKAVNDSLGHEAGDTVLNEVAERLTRCVRDNDVVARLGGDEFAVLLTKMIDQQDAANTASRIIRALNEPIHVANRIVRVGGSVGVALHNSDNADVHSLLRGADVAMYLAKRQGKGRFEFFEQSHYDEIIDRIDIKADLEVALEKNQFEIHYQPIVDTDSAIIRSVEALLRWHHPVRGAIPPDKFIPLAEESGEINEIGRWVLHQTCRQVREWQMTIPHCGELRASVNLSARQLHDPDLLHSVTDALRTSGLSPEHLILEVTESLFVDDSTSSTRTLEQLTALKVKIAIDDFGTGYSSLSYLHSFPVDTIKIDQSFVQKLDESTTSNALVRTVVDLARAVGGTTVAEGVENQRQLDVLSELRCDLVQGFFFSRPLSASDFADLLQRRNAQEELLPLPSRRVPAVEARHPFSSNAFEKHAEVVSGLRQLDSILPALEAFHRDVNAPVTSRWSWLSSWFQLHPDTDVQCVFVRAVNHRIDAAALLGRRRENGRTRLFTLDNQMATVASAFARNEAAAEILAKGIADLAQEINGPWTLEINQIAGPNLVLDALQDHLTDIEIHEELAVPQVLIHPELKVDELLSKNMRKQLRRAHTKLEQHAPQWVVEFHRGTDNIMSMLPEIEAIHISRDHDRRNESDLDDAHARRFWQETIVTHTYTDELELATLKIGDVIAAYVISLVDGATYRVLDGRMNSDFAEFSPGRILETATLERAIKDPSFTTFDWMTGVAPETILAANFWQSRKTMRSSSVSEGSRRAINKRSGWETAKAEHSREAQSSTNPQGSTKTKGSKSAKRPQGTRDRQKVTSGLTAL